MVLLRLSSLLTSDKHPDFLFRHTFHHWVHRSIQKFFRPIVAQRNRGFQQCILFSQIHSSHLRLFAFERASENKVQRTFFSKIYQMLSPGFIYLLITCFPSFPINTGIVVLKVRSRDCGGIPYFIITLRGHFLFTDGAEAMTVKL